MRVAIVHDWLNGMRGGEKVLEQLLQLYPSATVHTLLFRPERISDEIKSHPIRTSFIQSLPYAQSKYRWMLPLFPAAIEQFDLSGFDLVVSNSHCCALGAIVPASAASVCYCFTPMRYAWEHFHLYFPPERYGWLMRTGIGWCMSRLRTWDYGAAQRVGTFIAISNCVARRIEKHYRRRARVVYPPVDTGFFTPGGAREPVLSGPDWEALGYADYRRVGAGPAAGRPGRGAYTSHHRPGQGDPVQHSGGTLWGAGSASSVRRARSVRRQRQPGTGGRFARGALLSVR